jgi:hypothetical protein
MSRSSRYSTSRMLFGKAAAGAGPKSEPFPFRKPPIA